MTAFNTKNFTLKCVNVTYPTRLSISFDRHRILIDENGNVCNWYRVSGGVSQGSVLGPLLFAICIIKLFSKLLISNHMIYADYSQIYHICLPSKILNGIELIHRVTQAVTDWATENELQLNLNRSKVDSCDSW